MSQTQRGFLFVSTCPSSFFRETSSCSAAYLRPFMAKLQCRAPQDYSAFHLPSPSQFGSFHIYRQCSQLRLKKPMVSSMISSNRSKIPQCLVDGPRSITDVHSSLIPGCFIRPASPLNSISSWSLNMVNARSSHDYVAFAKRHFSQVSRVKKQNKNFGGVDQHRKQLNAHVNKRATSSSGISASNEVNAMTSTEGKVGDVKLGSCVSTSPVSNNNPNSKVSGRKKKQTRTKTAKKQPSSIIASDTESSEAKSPTEELEKLTVKKSKQLFGDSASAKKQSNKKSRNPNGKGKSLKTISESAGKQKPQIVGKLNPLTQGTPKQFYPPIGKSVLVVESVTKAKVIQGYLGDMFEVLPSYGHVRDLAARSGSVRPDDDFSMVWEVPSAAWTHLKSIKVALSGAENLILASDPDREGEAIAWHIIEMLQQQDALRQGISVARVVFHEITEESVKNALQAPREIDLNLVNAYLARRAIDYLIGFNISPLLWRKLPGCQSAGRVQSAALSLICDREMEIDEFKPQEYWSIEGEFCTKDTNSLVNTHLTHFDSKKLNQHSISSHTEAKDIEQKINFASFQVAGAKESKIRRNPPTPYITSTLQQDAANKLHFPSMYTMKLAQKLYEGVQLSDGKATGLITYIRTDGLHISDEAVREIRSLVIERYGQDFASGSQRKYFKKVKNAQEAHEAIRPTNIQILPSMLVNVLDEDSLKLYTLIWSRTVACQMEPSTTEQIQVDISNADGSITLRAACSRVGFLGYQAVYEDIEAGAPRHKESAVYERQETFAILKSLKPGELLNLGEVKLEQHFTQAPPRYSEGSLVKKMEELGIGRPSTYASTLKVLQDRKYVTVKSRVLHPEFRGRMVSAFLSHHFTEVADYSFTADMETELDNVSAGLTEWKGLLRDYWTRFRSYCSRAESVHIHQVEKMLGKTFGDFLFGSLPDDKKTCPSCLEGALIFKVSRYGAGYFIGCDQHPKCKYIAKTIYGDEEEEEETPRNNAVEEPKLLGVHPVSNEKVLLKNGPYGFYVQLGEDSKGYTPKRASVSHIKDVDGISLEDALELLRYPVTLGNHPKDGYPVILRFAKAGLAVKHRRTIASVSKNMKRDDITLEKALELLSSKNVRRCGRPKKVKEVAEVL
ncbi:DNA topoisomerase 1 isoform X2 [Jatropha curcas]|uniref:DNA topoisomerase 1 isoform X2 n=1 Tax=Jatropha curcas TaxID=180498 RepID=UPI0009D742CA|nr:DNA topoisomerase 1 isoform X2 [Jatropha curcas]